MMSDTDIAEHFRGEKRFGGVIPAGLLKKATAGKFWILNLDIPSGEGTHWVLLSTLDKKNPFYFDPFGVPCDPGLIAAVRGKKSTPKILYSEIDYQGMANEDCGEFCLDVAIKLLAGQSPESILESFSPTDLANNAAEAVAVSEQPLLPKKKKKRRGKVLVGTGLPLTIF